MAKKNKSKGKEKEKTAKRGATGTLRGVSAALLRTREATRQGKSVDQGQEDPVESDQSSLHNTEFFDSDTDHSGPECLTCPCTPAKKPKQQARTPSPPPYTAQAPSTLVAFTSTTPSRALAAPAAPIPSSEPMAPLGPTPGPSRLPHQDEAHSPQTKHIKKWSAYVIYRGNQTGVFQYWGQVKAIVQISGGAVYKGFPSLALARTSYDLVRTWGLIDLLNTPTNGSDPIYVVVEGVAPGVYYDHYGMLRDGLYWGSGVVQRFNNVANANNFFVRSYMEHRVIILQPVAGLF
ncbi:hypothetical protein K435DRAFT_788708 [Dendrothele bispora CBS 962.96]|uniref:Ribonuclease H1 N-terminal domain-containing protein n=1 Tax=Dendrothele bispora (strain CBS 962.96) TaxID=1314807 RepID=A0A4V6T5R4_DENBC|nr:hypothetical protein K435DRAFT_788708 [Dendrothele bispora CBS 962.96]